MHEIEQTGIAKMSAPDQRATEGPKRDRKQVLAEKLKDHLSEDEWTSYKSLQKELTRRRQGRQTTAAADHSHGAGELPIQA